MIRSGLSILLSALTLGLGVVVPLMDRSAPAGAPVVESRHEPGTCVPGHDHLACVQQQMSDLLAVRHPGALALPPAIVGEASHAGASAAVSTPRTEGHPSRAPPLG